MPPQPLNSVRPGAHVLFSGAQGTALTQQPELAALVAQAIGLWSEVQFWLGNLLAVLLRANATHAVAMYLSLTSTAAQTAALKGAASAVLGRKRLELFDAVLAHVSTQGKQRDKLAHWLWAHSVNVPDALLLVDPRYRLRHNAKIQKIIRGARQRQWWAAFRFDQAYIYVYKKRDLEGIVADFQRAHSIVLNLSSVLARRGIPAAQALRRLSSLPEIQKELARRAKARKKTRPTRLRRPRGSPPP